MSHFPVRICFGRPIIASRPDCFVYAVYRQEVRSARFFVVRVFQFIAHVFSVLSRVVCASLHGGGAGVVTPAPPLPFLFDLVFRFLLNVCPQGRLTRSEWLSRSEWAFYDACERFAPV